MSDKPQSPDAATPEERPPGKPAEGVEFTINADGSVTFTNLPPELMDIALALNPDATLACDLPGSDDSSSKAD